MWPLTVADILMPQVGLCNIFRDDELSSDVRFSSLEASRCCDTCAQKFSEQREASKAASKGAWPYVSCN